MLFGKIERGLDTFDRNAYSFASRARTERTELVNRIEFRVDESVTARQEQWVTTNRLDFEINQAFTFVSRFDYSVAENELAAVRTARFGEVDLGVAYRPVDNSRLNALVMYTYLYDLDPVTQKGGNLFDEKGHVLSMEGLYDLTDRWALGGKIAWKQSEIRLDRDAGRFFDTNTRLTVARARYHFVKRWDGLIEYRLLDAGDRKSGALAAIDYQIKDNFKLGIGYNFTDFEDDLTNLNYDARGWFVNFLGKY